MKSTTILLAGLLSYSGIAAYAETPDPSGQFAVSVSTGRTRTEVLAELKDAQRNGDIVASGEGGTEYERNPNAFPARTMAIGRSREEVRAETLQAIRDGDIIGGEAGLAARDLLPHRYMARAGSDRGQRTARALR